MSDRELLERLIAFDSVSANSNRPIAAFAAEYLSAAGCNLWRQVYDDSRKENLYCWKVPKAAAGNEDSGLLLAAHLDVVPANEPNWTTPPFALNERGGRFFARGSTDMKGWAALAINRLAAAQIETLRAPLAIVLTADEEIGSLGAQRFAAEVRSVPDRRPFPLPRACLVGEPTQGRVVRMHKGHAKWKIVATGCPAHSGYPHLGVNAITMAGRVLQNLSRLTDELQHERTEASGLFPECPHPVLNVGAISGGGAVNVVPERCEMQFGVRLLPGQRTADVLPRIERAVRSIEHDPRGTITLEMMNDSPPMLCDSAAPLHIALCELANQRESASVSYASDAGWLSTLGLDCVLCGPGSIEDAHRADESIGVAEWAAGGAFLSRVIERFCG